MSDGTLSARIEMLVDRHGSLRNVGKVFGIDHAYLCRLQNGDKVNPSEAVLKKLGLERVVTYRLRQSDRRQSERRGEANGDKNV